jgi:hypothetical protein
MGILQEIWTKDMSQQLFEKNLTFLDMATDHSAYLNYRSVNVPQAGTIANVSDSDTVASSTPRRAAVLRTDTILSYNITSVETDLLSIEYSDELQTSYPKRDSIMNAQFGILAQRAGTQLLNTWSLASATASATSVVYMSGATSSAFLTNGQTGGRNLPTITDLLNLGAILTEQNFPMEDRVLVVTPRIYAAIMSNTSIASAFGLYGSNGNQSPIVENSLPMIAGFTLVVRPSVAVYTSAGALKSYSAAGKYTVAATDDIAAVAYHKSAVSWATDRGQVFVGQEGDPQYGGGTSLIGKLMIGGSKLRSDNTGIAMLIMGNK